MVVVPLEQHGNGDGGEGVTRIILIGNEAGEETIH